MFKRFIHNLTTCEPNGSWNGTQMVIITILIIAMVFWFGYMEHRDYIMYGV